MEGRNGDRYRNVFRCGPWYQDAWEKNEKKTRKEVHTDIAFFMSPTARTRNFEDRARAFPLAWTV